MPITREEHIDYTRNELKNYEYYIKLLKTLKSKDIKTYIDIGANVGEFCNILFEELNTLNHAYLIEPENENFLFMLNNVVRKDNVTPINVGIGYNITDGTLLGNNNVGGFKIIEGGSGQKIDVKTLEELNLPLVDLVKIDVEGMEYNIIENSTYLQKIKWIDVEFHDYHNKPLRPYVSKYFPNHTIVEIENLGGRCLLKNNDYE
jgi:FkbM family methyltransferase